MASFSQKYATILGVRLNSTPKPSLLRKIVTDIRNKRQFYIVTPNPEIVMAAQNDVGLMTALNASEVAIADGIGLAVAYKYLNMWRPKPYVLRVAVSIVQGLVVGSMVILNRPLIEKEVPIIKGRDLFLELIELSNKYGWRVYFLGGEGDEAIGAKHELEKNYKKIIIKTNRGPILNINGTPKTSTDEIIENEVIKDINSFSPAILFVGISHPRQEKWLYRQYRKLKINGAMTVGGTFKYFSKQVALPPKFVDNIGFSWLWRLVTGDQRLSRILTAVVNFPLKVFFHKVSKA